MAQVTISYERRFSDGNFGNEGLSCTLTSDVGDLDSDATYAVITALVDKTRRVVLTTLAGSAKLAVASAAAAEAEGHGIQLLRHARLRPVESRPRA